MRTNRRLMQVHRDILTGDPKAKQPKVFLKQNIMESADCEPTSALCRSSPGTSLCKLRPQLAPALGPLLCPADS
jgi:hypothetical protein